MKGGDRVAIGSTEITTALRATAALVAVIALLTTAACDAGGPPADTTMSANPDAQFQQMMQRPDIDQATQRYAAMGATIRNTLVADIGLPSWKERPDSGGSSSCREFPGVNTGDKESRGLPLMFSEANLPDEKWPHAQQIITEIAGKNGFGAPLTLVNNPGNHEISLKDGYGAEVSFGTKVNTTLLIQTGCHLTADAHKRGKPTEGP
jgi:hypothetical protein